VERQRRTGLHLPYTPVTVAEAFEWDPADIVESLVVGAIRLT
jgi:hypothetical protein